MTTERRTSEVLVASGSRTSVLDGRSIVVISGSRFNPLNNRVVGTFPAISTGVAVSAPVPRTALSSTASRDEVLRRQAPDSSKNEFSSLTERRVPAGGVEGTPLSLPGSSDRKANEEAYFSVSHDKVKAPSVKRKISEEDLERIRADIATVAQCYHAHDYASVLSLLRAVPLHEFSNTPDQIVIVVYVGQGLAHYKTKHYNDGMSFCLKALKAADDAGWIEDACFVNFYLAELEYAQNNFLSASDYFGRSARGRGKSKVGEMLAIEMPSRAVIYCKQATALRYGSKIIESVQLYKRSIVLAKSLTSKKDELTSHTSLGNLYQSIGENSRAVEEYLQTLELARDLHDYASLGLAEGNLGNAYLALHMRDNALKHLRISFEHALAHDPTPQAIGRAYNNLGTAFQAMGELEQAKEYYDLALSQAVYGNDLPGQARVYGNIGNLLMLQRMYTEAIVHYSETLSISRDRATQTTAYHNRGCARYERAEVERKQFLEGDSTNDVELLARGKSCLTFVGNGMDDCDDEYRFLSLPESLIKQYRDAKRDLEKVMKHHEHTFREIKGSPQGLSLSVSLFETNSSTFQRLQDCSYFLGEWQQALVFAEQSRSRTLGELMLEHNQDQLKFKFRTPLELPQLVSIVCLQEMPVVYLSYTGSRLLVWVLVPGGCKSMDADINMFQVTFDPNQFNDKSFEHLLKYTLPESLIDEQLDMFNSCNYNQETLLMRFHDLITKPMLTIFKSVLAPEKLSELQDVILIPDSHTKLMPMAALHNRDTYQFLGDRIRFHIMHSLLTYGILCQLPSVTINVPLDSANMCIVGNPIIPSFNYQGEDWNLGRLPFATEEAEWVSHILQAKPTLHEQATKQVVLSELIKAKVVHLATHGSASAGFLVFAGASSFTSRLDGFDPNSLLLHPEEVESLNLPAALVVLSSCDSGRGTLKAEGIQGIARSFLLAGAQAVLTSLWRVPDESASLFMQFLYRYLVDGLKSFQALQKAMLSLRCYLKYSEYIHWSGYQLTGREIQFCSSPDTIRQSLGSFSAFPQLVLVLEIHKVLTANAISPTTLPSAYSISDWKFANQIGSKGDIQLLLGSIATCPMELAKDYIAKYYQHYTGGVYWVSGWCRELISSAVESIAQALASLAEEKPGVHSEEALLEQISAASEPILLVLDHISMLPLHYSALTAVMQKSDVHIIVCSGYSIHPEGISRPAHEKLFRGCTVKHLSPLNQLQVTQRLVYPIISAHDFFPLNEEQVFFHELALLVGGSPAIVALTSAVLLHCIDQSQDKTVQMGLDNFKESVILPIKRTHPHQNGDRVCPAPMEVVMFHLLQRLQLSVSQQLLLSCLSVLQGAPVHELVLSTLEKTLLECSGYSDLRHRLQISKLLVQYPSPVVKPAGRDTSGEQIHLFYQVPPTIAQSFWSAMDRNDRAIAVALLKEAVQELSQNTPLSDRPLMLHTTGLRFLISQTVANDQQTFTLGVLNECFSSYISDKKNSAGGLLDLQADVLLAEAAGSRPIHITDNET